MDEHKTKKQLIDELTELRRRVTELQAVEADRKRAEDALRESEEKWRSLVKNARNTIIIADRDGLILFINHLIPGTTEEGTIGKSVYEFIPSEYHDVARKAIERAFGIGELGRYETIGPGPSGVAGWYITQVGPIMRGTQIVAVSLIATNITERKLAEIELQKHPVHLKELVVARTGELTRVNEQLRQEVAERKRAEERQRLVARILDVLNRATEESDAIREILLLIKQVTGMEAVGIRLRKGEDFPYYETNGFPGSFVEAERYLCARDQAGELSRDSQGNPVLECMCGNIICGRTDPSLPFFTEGGSFWSNNTTALLASTTEEERQARTRNRCNSEGYESVALVPLRSGSEIVGLLQLNDSRTDMFTSDLIAFLEEVGASVGISLARARAEEEVKQYAAQLDASNKELEAFAYSVSHDLRAPLRGMDGFSQALLEDYSDKVGEQGRDYLKRVRAGAQRMGALIEDLLNLSRVTRSEMRREQVDMSALARRIADELKQQQPERDVEFIIQEGLEAEADAALLRVVLENLLGNAWKFTGKEEKSRIEFGSTECEGETEYFVRDNGVGFDMAYADKLFGAFQRLHSSVEFPGTGIGLATVQRVVHRHGGRVRAEGEVGEGATFFFTLGA